MPIRNSTLLAIVLIFAFAAVRPADAQLVGTDTVPGSSCAGFPDGATRVTADADLDGGEVTLVCDGTTWSAVENGGLESVSGLSAPPSNEPALSCTQRSGTNNASCNAGEIMTGGGCLSSSGTANLRTNNPSAADTWSCTYSGGTVTAYAICCTF